MPAVERIPPSPIKTTVHKDKLSTFADKFNPLEGNPHLNMLTKSAELLLLGILLDGIGLECGWPWVAGAIIINLAIQSARAGRAPDAEKNPKVPHGF